MVNSKNSLSIQIIMIFCYLYFFLSLCQAEVTLTIGDGSGLPGTNENVVEVRLDNLNYRVKGLQVDVCDVDDFLSCTACETTERSSGFTCKTNERENGCCRVILVSDSGDLIEKGTGAIFTIKYDVSDEAPGGECRDLNTENVKVSDELENELAVNISSGKFCFFVCGDIYPDESSPGSNDCGDGEVDIFDVLDAIDIVLGIGVHSGCQWARADLPTGTPPNCRDPDGIIDIFDILVIIDLVLNREDCCSYYYGMIKCTSDEDCNDGVYCNGTEICVDGVCQPGTDPCPDDGLYCNGEELCLEDTDSCRPLYDPCDDLNDCTDDICYEVDDSCSNVCNASGFGDPCCNDPACVDAPQCGPRVTIDPGEVWANPVEIEIEVPLCLSNLEDAVGGVSLDLCESFDDCLECTRCEVTNRTTVFGCMVNELANGCCAVVLFSTHPGDVINRGKCDIVRVVYVLDEDCDLTECITLTTTNIVVSDPDGIEIGAIGLTGSVCPFRCGDVYPADDPSVPGWDCGDGKVDVMDIVEETDFVLRKKTPDDCQLAGADVPTGTPPDCNDPDEAINILDLMVVIDMALHRQNCCDYYYSEEIY